MAEFLLCFQSSVLKRLMVCVMAAVKWFILIKICLCHADVKNVIILYGPKVLDLTSHFDKMDKIKPDFIRYDMPEVCMDRDSYNRLLKGILNENQINSDDIKWTGHFINKVD